MIQVEAYIKFLVNVAKQCTLWERALKIRFRLDLWLSCLLTSDFYRWLWIRSYSFVKKGRENFLYKTETNSFHFFHFDKVESLSLSLLCTTTQCLILAILGPMTRYYTDWKQNKIIQRVLMNSVLAKLGNHLIIPHQKSANRTMCKLYTVYYPGSKSFSISSEN